ncbi:neuronal acetylcholine receptor subunit alpha-6 [Elysia marginata]|uniref:Neuronal acetylcholine receptor subunit alpha-6 n=1 Tax=Elysia marginata TaxID=1093978 RepID=A0AAV4GG68_9GAST|nr:neuronal acetylcholine receptor subunit alpha-6 [Elysia marginata]
MTVTVAATIGIIWTEPAFSWDSTNTSVFAVSVSTRDIWTPVLLNPLAIDTDELLIEMPSQVRVHHTGKIQTVQKFTITVSCSFNMEWFPFDEQTCLFPIMPHNADSANLNTLPDPEPAITLRITDEHAQGDWSWERVTPRLIVNEVDINEDVPKKLTYVSFERLPCLRSGYSSSRRHPAKKYPTSSPSSSPPLCSCPRSATPCPRDKSKNKTYNISTIPQPKSSSTQFHKPFEELNNTTPEPMRLTTEFHSPIAQQHNTTAQELNNTIPQPKSSTAQFHSPISQQHNLSAQ